MDHKTKNSGEPNRNMLAYPPLSGLEAEFLFVSADEVARVQTAQGAIGFDAPGAAYPHKNAEGFVRSRHLFTSGLRMILCCWRWRGSSRRLTSKTSWILIRPLAAFPMVTQEDHKTEQLASFLYEALYASLKETKN